MARVVAYVPDLLFGSNVIGMLRAAGHVAVLVPDEPRLEREGPGSDLVVVDLTHEAAERARAARGSTWSARRPSPSTPTSTPTPAASPSRRGSTRWCRARAWLGK